MEDIIVECGKQEFENTEDTRCPLCNWNSVFEVCYDPKIKDNYPEEHGVIYGIYEFNAIEYESVNGENRIKFNTKKSFSEMPLDNIIPSCNVFVNINGIIKSYYPLWVHPNFMKIRNAKLESIGI